MKNPTQQKHLIKETDLQTYSRNQLILFAKYQGWALVDETSLRVKKPLDNSLTFSYLGTLIKNSNNPFTYLEIHYSANINESDILSIKNALTSPNNNIFSLNLVGFKENLEHRNKLLEILKDESCQICSLDLSGDKFYFRQINDLCDVLQHNKKIIHLNLSNSDLDDYALSKLCILLDSDKFKLQSLNLSHNPSIIYFQGLIDVLMRSHPSLTALNLSHNHLCKEFEKISEMLQQANNITSLNLKDTNLSVDSSKKLFSAMKSPNCKVEEFSFNLGFEHDDNYMSILGGYDQFHLTPDNIDAIGLLETLESPNCKITNLDLSNNKLSSRGVTKIINSLDGIKEIDFTNNDIGRHGAEEILSSLKKCEKIKLCNNNLNLFTLKQDTISDVLTYLEVVDDSLPESFFLALLEKLNTCKIEHLRVGRGILNYPTYEKFINIIQSDSISLNTLDIIVNGYINAYSTLPIIAKSLVNSPKLKKLRLFKYRLDPSLKDELEQILLSTDNIHQGMVILTDKKEFDDIISQNAALFSIMYPTPQPSFISGSGGESKQPEVISEDHSVLFAQLIYKRIEMIKVCCKNDEISMQMLNHLFKYVLNWLVEKAPRCYREQSVIITLCKVMAEAVGYEEVLKLVPDLLQTHSNKAERVEELNEVIFGIFQDTINVNAELFFKTFRNPGQSYILERSLPIILDLCKSDNFITSQNGCDAFIEYLSFMRISTKIDKNEFVDAFFFTRKFIMSEKHDLGVIQSSFQCLFSQFLRDNFEFVLSPDENCIKDLLSDSETSLSYKQIKKMILLLNKDKIDKNGLHNELLANLKLVKKMSEDSSNTVSVSKLGLMCSSADESKSSQEVDTVQCAAVQRR